MASSFIFYSLVFFLFLSLFFLLQQSWWRNTSIELVTEVRNEEKIKEKLPLKMLLVVSSRLCDLGWSYWPGFHHSLLTGELGSQLSKHLRTACLCPDHATASKHRRQVAALDIFVALWKVQVFLKNKVWDEHCISPTPIRHLPIPASGCGCSSFSAE